MLQLLLLFSLGLYSLANPEIGPLYDCAKATKLGVYSIPKPTICTTFHVDDIRYFTAEIQHYQEQVTPLRMFLCTTKRIILNCKESFFGVDQKSVNTVGLHTTVEVCSRAVRFKRTPYGRMKKVSHTKWVSVNSASYRCKWVKTTHVAFIQFQVKIVKGVIIDNDRLIHQDLTSTQCRYNERYCRPIETPFKVLWWIYSKFNQQLYKSLGIHNGSMTNSFILFNSLGIGGTIIYKKSRFWLLDVGYIVIIQNTQSRRRPGNLSPEKRGQFYNYSINYVKKRDPMCKGNWPRIVLLEMRY